MVWSRMSQKHHRTHQVMARLSEPQVQLLPILYGLYAAMKGGMTATVSCLVCSYL